MRFELKIDYPAEKMEQSRKRLEARAKFRYVDRVPVLYCAVPRYFAPLFNLRYLDFFKDVETHYYWQLQFAKYRIENVPDILDVSVMCRVLAHIGATTRRDAGGGCLGGALGG